jgi:hypothetical protein
MSDEDSYLATRLREVASTVPIGDRKKLIWSSMRNVSNQPTQGHQRLRKVANAYR